MKSNENKAKSYTSRSFSGHIRRWSCFTTTLTIILLLCIHTSPSFARLHGAESKSQRDDDAAAGFGDMDTDTDASLSLSKHIPPLQDTMELVRLSNMVYAFRSEHAKDCSSFPSIFDSFASQHVPFDNDANFTFHCHMYERDGEDTQVLVVSRTKETPAGTKFSLRT